MAVTAVVWCGMESYLLAHVLIVVIIIQGGFDFGGSVGSVGLCSVVFGSVAGYLVDCARNLI